MTKRIGKNDIILILVILVVAIVAFFFIQIQPSSGENVTVTIDGKTYGTYSLTNEQTIDIKDNEGNVTNTLQIKDGKAYMFSADCPDQLCVKQNKISKNNESIICLPNKVVISVDSDIESDIDTVSK